jgi:hypothetical protein
VIKSLNSLSFYGQAMMKNVDSLSFKGRLVIKSLNSLSFYGQAMMKNVDSLSFKGRLMIKSLNSLSFYGQVMTKSVDSFIIQNTFNWFAFVNVPTSSSWAHQSRQQGRWLPEQWL